MLACLLLQPLNEVSMKFAMPFKKHSNLNFKAFKFKNGDSRVIQLFISG